MPSPEEAKKRQEAHESLTRMHDFDTSLLPRERELGSVVNFMAAIPPAERLLSIYRRISLTLLEDLPDSQLNSLLTQANSDYNILKSILEFKPGTAENVRNSLISQLDNTYQQTFNSLQHFISLSSSKSTDFQGLERQGRATIQTVEDLGKKMAEQLEAKGQEAEKVLELVRKSAAEQGVSQQASYFRDEAKIHENEANIWSSRIIKGAILLGAYTIATLFFHKLSWIKPDDAYQTAQLAISKVLIFGVLSYMLYLATKNYLAHKHNAIINKHRQNALMTYKALVDAAEATANKEVILTHASGCIFAPQTTGYSADSSTRGPAAKSVIELMTNAMARK